MRTYTLPKEFGEKWVAALRSGEYKQTGGKLYDTIGYCCLGVACSISGVENHELYGVGYPYQLTTHDLVNVPEFIKDYNIEGTLVNALTDMNDRGYPFPEIADWIEQNVKFV